jgi:hypothetical protein
MTASSAISADMQDTNYSLGDNPRVGCLNTLNETEKENGMNIIKVLLERIESYRVENKQPCKNYATKERAEKATEEMARIAGLHFDSRTSARYIVFYNEHWNRWIGAVDMSELLSRHDSKGGYLGICSRYNFYSY